MKLKWHRSRDGYTGSKCGRFDISPLFYGNCNPVDYEVEDNTTGKKRRCNTQRAAKAWAQERHGRDAKFTALVIAQLDAGPPPWQCPKVKR